MPLKDAVVERAILYGSIATPLPQKRSDEAHTHRWTVYIKGADDEDISYYVKKVVFKLHESFVTPLRGL